MPRPAVFSDNTKSPELATAERKGQDLLHSHCRQRVGNAKDLVDNTGLHASVISRMSNYTTPINLEAAMLLDVASNGQLPADVLCPSRADLIQRFIASRTLAAAA